MFVCSSIHYDLHEESKFKVKYQARRFLPLRALVPPGEGAQVIVESDSYHLSAFAHHQ